MPAGPGSVRFSLATLMKATLTAAIVLGLGRLTTPQGAIWTLVVTVVSMAWCVWSNQLLLALQFGVFLGSIASIVLAPDFKALGFWNFALGGGYAAAIWLLWFPQLWTFVYPRATPHEVLQFKTSVSNASRVALGLQLLGALALIVAACRGMQPWNDWPIWLGVAVYLNVCVLAPWFIAAQFLATPHTSEAEPGR